MSWFSKTFKKIASPLEDLAGSAVGSLVGGIINSHFQDTNNAYSAGLSLQNSKDLFKYQNQNKYQFMVDDLNKAGLNPMLAVGGMQGSSGGIISGSSSPIDTAGINNASAQRAQIRIAEKNAETELLKAKAEAKLAYSQAETEDYMRTLNGNLVNAQTIDLNSQMVDRAFRVSMDFEDLLMRNVVHGYEIKKILADIKFLASSANLNDAQTKQILQEVNSLDKQYHREWMSTEPGRDLFKIADLVKTLMGAIGTVGVFTGKLPGRIGVGSN